jgi:hypothetical protein
MKKQICLILLSALFSFNQLSAQEEKASKEWNVGFQLNQFQSDFGLGVNVVFPSIIKDALVIRLRANMMFFEQVIAGKTEWTPYSNVMLGVSSKKYKVADFMAMYGEGGVIGILPSSKFSSSDIDIGGYGIFGFEFFFVPEFNYFIELGGVGTGAVADKLPFEPIYSNGFLASVGWRMNF